MPIKTWGRTALTGGVSGALDALDADNLIEGMRAITVESVGEVPEVYEHRLNASSGAAESSPDVIKPDSGGGVSPYTGDKRWILVARGKLVLPDTDASHWLQIKWNEDDSANRVLNLLLGAGDRSLRIFEDLTIGDPVSNECNLSVASNIDIDTGTETVDSFADTIGDGAIWFYVVKKSTNLRTGIVMAAWEATGNTVEYTGSRTLDIGDTSDLALAVDIDSDTVRLRATAASDDWEVRVQRMVL